MPVILPRSRAAWNAVRSASRGLSPRMSVTFWTTRVAPFTLEARGRSQLIGAGVVPTSAVRIGDKQCSSERFQPFPPRGHPRVSRVDNKEIRFRAAGLPHRHVDIPAFGDQRPPYPQTSSQYPQGDVIESARPPGECILRIHGQPGANPDQAARLST